MKDKLLDYIHYISKPQESLGGFPICPFAKQYFEQVEFDFSESIEDRLEYYYNNYPDDKKLVLLIHEDIETYSVDRMNNILKENEQKFAKKDFWIMYDHPKQVNVIGDVQTNNKHYSLMLIQRLNELIQFSDSLHKTKYYDNWPEQYYNEIVASRKHLNA